MRRDRAILLSDLEDRLRVLARRRIVAGEMSGAELARRAGFQQAHVSRFLNRRRGLTIEAMDRLLRAMRLEVQDLIPRNGRSALVKEADGAALDAIPVIQPAALLQGRLEASDVIEYLHFKTSFLRRLRPEMASARGGWQRFVLVKASRKVGTAMRPRLAPGAMLLIDRHYNSLRSYRPRVPNLYAVSSGADWQICYLELQCGQLTLRPENQHYPLGCIQPARGETFAAYVAGRVAQIAMQV